MIFGSGGIRNGKSRLAAADARLPGRSAAASAGAAGFTPAAPAAAPAAACGSCGRAVGWGRHVGYGDRRVTRAAHGAVVLPVAVDPIRHLVVDRHVIHLADRQRHAGEVLAVIGGDAHPAVPCGYPVVGIHRVHPDVVAVPASASGNRESKSPVGRPVEAAVGDQHFVRIGRVDRNPDVVSRAPDQGAVPTHHPPGSPGIIRAPERSLVWGLNQRIHALGVRRGNGDVDFPHRRLRQPGMFQFFPARAAVARHVNPAALAAAEHGIGVHDYLPGAGDEDVRIVGIHGNTRAAGVGIDEKHALP
jgi:hypothetical protein